MKSEDVAQRLSFRDGLRLRDYIEIALPVYRLRLRAITIARKSIPPIEEFVLRALAMDICSVQSLSAFLGLEDRVLRPAVISLIESDDIAATPSQAEGEFQLTQKGRVTAEKHIMISTEERTFSIYFDALTRKALWYRNEQLIPYQEMKTRGLREISQYPSVRPKVGDLRIVEIDSVLKSLQQSSDVRRDLVAIRGIEACRKWFVPALALIYSRDDNADLQVGVAIDGKLSQAHERALMPTQSFAEFIRDSASINKEALGELTSVRELDAESVRASEELQKAISKAQINRRRVEDDLAGSDSPAADETLRSRLRELEEQILRLTAEAQSLPVKNIYVNDHPPLLQDALKTSKERVLIISPWITGEVVDKDFIHDMERLLRAGVSIHIGHGITPSATKKARAADVAAKAAIESLANTYKNLQFIRLGNTHAKVLIKDHEFAAVTSSNWLSFRGDPNRTYRDEQGTLLQSPSLVDGKFAEVIKQFP